jgi:hypothetical protein
VFVRTGARTRRGGALRAIYSRLVELGIVGKDMVRCGCRWVLGDEAAHPACAKMGEGGDDFISSKEEDVHNCSC